MRAYTDKRGRSSWISSQYTKTTVHFMRAPRRHVRRSLSREGYREIRYRDVIEFNFDTDRWIFFVKISLLVSIGICVNLIDRRRKNFWKLQCWFRYILLNMTYLYEGAAISMYRVFISYCEITFLKWSERKLRLSWHEDEEFFYRGEVMALALCQVWVNDVTAEGITSVTKSARSSAVREPSTVTPPDSRSERSYRVRAR